MNKLYILGIVFVFLSLNVFAIYSGESTLIPALYFENGVPTDGNANITISDVSGTTLVDNLAMVNEVAVGEFSYNYTFSTSGDYLTKVNFYDASWILLGTAQEWVYADLENIDSIRSNIIDEDRVYSNRDYKFWIYNYDIFGSLQDVSAIEYYLTNPEGLDTASFDVNLTSAKESNGVYYETYNMSSTSLGYWTITANITTLENTSTTAFSKFTLFSSPTKISVDVTDKSYPGVEGRITIQNEGNTDYEYLYYYWISSSSGSDYGDVGNIGEGSFSKLISAGDTQAFNKAFTLPDTTNVGDVYYFKAKVYYGDYSYASSSFILEQEDTTKDGGVTIINNIIGALGTNETDSNENVIDFSSVIDISNKELIKFENYTFRVKHLFLLLLIIIVVGMIHYLIPKSKKKTFS